MTDWAGFAVRRIRLADVELAVRVGGQGAATRASPRLSAALTDVARRGATLAERFTVIVPDQRPPDSIAIGNSRRVADELRRLANNIGEARLWAGVHWLDDHVAGQKIGRSAAQAVIEQ